MTMKAKPKNFRILSFWHFGRVVRLRNKCFVIESPETQCKMFNNYAYFNFFLSFFLVAAIKLNVYRRKGRWDGAASQFTILRGRASKLLRACWERKSCDKNICNVNFIILSYILSNRKLILVIHNLLSNIIRDSRALSVDIFRGKTKKFWTPVNWLGGGLFWHVWLCVCLFDRSANTHV